MNQDLMLMIIQVIIIVILFIVIVFMLRQNISIRHERRIGRYSIEPIKSDSLSVFDNLSIRYFKFVKKIRKLLLKSKLIERISRRYEKYTLFGKDNMAVDYIVHKLIIAITFVLLTVFSQVLQTRLVTLFELLFNFLLGYYILDLYLMYRSKIRIKKIENEMLRAIIIMNNAF